MVADVQSGASFKFDGVNDEIGGTPTQYPSGSSARSVEMWVKVDSITAFDTLFSYGTLTANQAFNINFNNSTNGYLSVGKYGADSSGGSNSGLSNSQVPVGEWVHIIVTHDGTQAINYYLNGVADGNAVLSGLNTVTSLFTFGKGISSWGNPHFDGEIRQLRIHNRALTADEVRAAYNGQAVSFEHTGASQTELWDSAASVFTSGTYNWVVFSSNTIANVSNQLAITYVDSADGAYVHFKNSADLSSDLEVGKRYRLTLDAKYAGGSSGVNLLVSDGVATAATSSALTTSMVTYNLEFTAAHATNAFVRPNGMAASNVVTIDNLSLTKIGCVAEYLPTGINSTQWVDTSGNGLTGTTSTATAINHEVGTITATGVVEVNNGIKFPATQVSSADPNTLDDYEVGTCTLTIQEAQTSPSNTASLGTFDYARIGDIVTLTGRAYNVDISGFTSSDLLYIVGFPYAGTSVRDMSGHLVGADAEDVGFYWGSATAIKLTKIDSTGAGTSNLLKSDCANNISVSIFGSYKATA